MTTRNCDNSNSYPKSKLTRILDSQEAMKEVFNLKLGHITEKLDNMVTKDSCAAVRSTVESDVKTLKRDTVPKLETWVGKISNRFWALILGLLFLLLTSGVGLLVAYLK